MALTDNEKNEVIDLNIDGIKKTQFRINGRNDLILELDLSDMRTSVRLQEGYERIQEQVKILAELPEDADMLKELDKIDKALRKELDYIFDSNVSEVCGSGGTMYDIKNGEFRFESIINTLTKLYTDNLNEEYKKMKKRIQAHTEPYVGSSKKSRKRG